MLTCGIPVHGRKRTEVYPYSLFDAPIGGIVYLYGKPYGLSTAHSFRKEYLSTSAPDDESDFEFANSDWEESDSFDGTSKMPNTSGQLRR